MPDISAMQNKDNIDGMFESENFEANILGFINTLLSDGSKFDAYWEVLMILFVDYMFFSFLIY